MLTVMMTRLRTCVSTVNHSSPFVHIIGPFLRIRHLLGLVTMVCLCTILLTLRFGEDTRATALLIPLYHAQWKKWWQQQN